MYLIIPFEVKECVKCGTFNLLCESVCCCCGTQMEVPDGNNRDD